MASKFTHLHVIANTLIRPKDSTEYYHKAKLLRDFIEHEFLKEENLDEMIGDDTEWYHISMPSCGIELSPSKYTKRIHADFVLYIEHNNPRFSINGFRSRVIEWFGNNFLDPDSGQRLINGVAYVWMGLLQSCKALNYASKASATEEGKTYVLSINDAIMDSEIKTRNI